VQLLLLLQFLSSLLLSFATLLCLLVQLPLALSHEHLAHFLLLLLQVFLELGLFLGLLLASQSLGGLVL